METKTNTNTSTSTQQIYKSMCKYLLLTNRTEYYIKALIELNHTSK